MKVTIYSHNFAVTGYNRYGYEFLKRFGVANFGEVDYRAIRTNKYGARFNKQPLPTISKTYAASLKNGREFRFHLNALQMFKDAVANDPVLRNTIDYEMVPLYEPTSMEINVLPKYSPFDEQIPLIAYLKSPGTSKVLSLRTGGGKMQDVKEPVLTPQGWREIGTLKIGDKIITPRGKIANVIGTYPHRNKKLYRFTTEDGRTTLVGKEHLWAAYVNGETRYRVMSTEDIMLLMQRGNKVRLPAIENYRGTEHTGSLLLRPFDVGLLFVVGSLRNNVICTHCYDPSYMCLFEDIAVRMGAQLKFTESDHVGFRIVADRKQIDNYQQYLAKLKLFKEFGALGDTGELPQHYLNGGIETRRQLLDGILMGLKIRGFHMNGYSYRITNKVFRDPVLYLARSLGYNIHVDAYSGEKWGKKRGIIHEVDLDPNTPSTIMVREIVYEKTGDAMCIAVDDPEHLYITRDFLVTHNTYCALQASSDFNQRILISIEKRFFNLWAEALEQNPDPELDKQILDLKPENVLYVAGSKELCALMELALQDKLKDIPVIVVASRTLGIFFETYERYGADTILYYPVLPIQFFELLGVGTRIKDELHLSFHANFKEELYLHAPRSLSLSATLEDGSFKDKMLEVMFPHDMRAPESELKKYIDVTALMYHLTEPDKAEYTIRGSTDYSHNSYEKWLLKDKRRKENYLRIVTQWLKYRYVDNPHRIPKTHRAAIFATSIEMATVLRDRLQQAYPELTVSRYAASAGDVYVEAREAEVMVTTVQSFGTGFDLDGLICSFLTASINSYKTNVQVLGRLRELRKWKEIIPVFDYLVCADIPKQMSYHEEKIRQFAPRVRSHKTSFINTKV